MAEADDKVITPALRPWSTPELNEIHFASARFEGESDLHADPHRHVNIDIDGPPPPSGHEWLLGAANRMAAEPDSPPRTKPAARKLGADMFEAFLRRQVTETWTVDSIRNLLAKWRIWPSRRR